MNRIWRQRTPAEKLDNGGQKPVRCHRSVSFIRKVYGAGSMFPIGTPNDGY